MCDVYANSVFILLIKNSQKSNSPMGLNAFLRP